ncbi:MAG: hypothetical protein AMXMBFR25_28280 [Lysobacterales bacterium]|nr:hypothetical protein [Xanthomonadales bacterium]
MFVNSDNKVVDLQQRQAAQAQQADRVGDLIKHARGIAQKRLALLVGALFDSVDDALFDLAEKAENNLIQTRYFDGMREVRKKRQLVERLFQEALTREFASFGQVSRNGEESSASGGFALVDEHELEETLAVSAMAGKAANRLARPLYALAQRMSVLAGGNKIGDDNNPVAPKALCQAFRTTLPELEVDLHVKLLILKLFDKHVMGGLDGLYDEINQHLIQSGVLPQLKHQLPDLRRPGAPAAPGSAAGMLPGESPSAVPMEYDPGAAVAASPAGAMYTAATVSEAELQIELYNTVRSLLSARRAIIPGGMPGGGLGIGGAPGPSFATDELVNALTVLQSRAMALGGMGANYGPMVMLPAAQIKDELVGQLQRLGTGDDHHRVAAADEDTIDLVGMLFEFILQDRNLPAEMQALLARLQIPYLKCAILDKALFARKEHPARLLLDELAQAGLGWSEEADKDGRFYEKAKSVVETLLKEFDDNVQIFEQQLQDFREFMASSKKRAEVAELRAAEAARGRERLQGARKTAAREILSRIEGRRLPEVIRHILTRPWANVLVLTVLRQGEGSHPWKTALRVADELVWAAEEKHGDGERARMRALIPELDKALRQGLAMVAYHDNDVRQLLADLGAFFESQINPEAPRPERSEVAVTADGASAAAGETPVEENFVDELARQPDSAEAEPDPDAEVQDNYYDLARAIKVGTWVEFRHADGRAERAKLSWISPISSKYLFVNRKGLKVADKTIWALAAELRHQRAMLLEDVPLFDRALDAIVERLKSSAPGEGAAGDAHA